MNLTVTRPFNTLDSIHELFFILYCARQSSLSGLAFFTALLLGFAAAESHSTV